MIIEMEQANWHTDTIGKAAREAIQAGLIYLLAADGRKTPVHKLTQRRMKGYRFVWVGSEGRIVRYRRGGRELGYYKVVAE